MMKMKKIVLFTIIGLGLSACGGGDDSSTPNNNNDSNAGGSTGNNNGAQYPVESVIIDLYTKGYSSEPLHALEGMHEWERQFEIIPKEDTVFKGKQVKSFETLSTLKSNGGVVNMASSTSYFTAAPFVDVGGIEITRLYRTAIKNNTVPKFANIGASGLISNTVTYGDSRETIKSNTAINTWSISKADNSNAWLCLDSTIDYVMQGNLDEDLSTCYKINVQGNVLDSKYIIKSANNLTFTSK